MVSALMPEGGLLINNKRALGWSLDAQSVSTTPLVFWNV
jgi:hypothetical protein